MKLKLMTTIAAGAFALSAIPVVAEGLSPSGGKREAGHSMWTHYRAEAGQSFNLVVPGVPNRTFKDIRRPLSPSGSDRR